MIRISQIKIHHHTAASVRNHEELNAHLIKKVAALLKIPADKIESICVSRHSVDARKKPDIFDVYTVDLGLKNANEQKAVSGARSQNIKILSKIDYEIPGLSCDRKHSVRLRPVVVGSGPAGLFCTYVLAQAGLRPILIERGKNVTDRKKDVDIFWSGGALNTESNVQFGEGGAGTFSDGKLYTGTNDRDGRQRFVTETFVRHGANSHILYEANPHIGTDRLRDIVADMRKTIESLGGDIRFSTKLEDLVTENGILRGIKVSKSTGTESDFEDLENSSDRRNRGSGNAPEEVIQTDVLVLAIGHSARDTFEMLRSKNVAMVKKSFAVGVRVAHPQHIINASMYGEGAPKTLPAAPYKLTSKNADGRGIYSFCMCPGGYIVNASSETGHTCVNGMSYSGRDGECANSAIVVTVSENDFSDADLLAGCAFQRDWEKRAYLAGQGKVPIEYFGSYLEKARKETGGFGIDYFNHCHLHVNPQEVIKGQYTEADVYGCLPVYLRTAVAEGLLAFGKKIKGFDSEGVLLVGVETRTSSPVRITRGEDYESVSIKGVFPCGEGAGYAGGIMSAATDGIKTAEAVLKRLDFK